MKRLTTGLCLCLLVMAQLTLAQQTTNNKIIIDTMETNLNKKAILDFYEIILNNRKFELLDSLIDEHYSSENGILGFEGFKQPLMALITAFPDAKWTIKDILAEGNKVFVKQQMVGTHEKSFQGIAPTYRPVKNEGMVIYEFRNRKVVHYQIQTDRLGFLQQLGIIQLDITTPSKNTAGSVFLVDEFTIPPLALDSFITKMTYNREFIKTIDGFVRDEVMISKDPTGNSIVMTVAVWKDEQYLSIAKELVQQEYARIGFDPQTFYQHMQISMKRQIYTEVGDQLVKL